MGQLPQPLGDDTVLVNEKVDQLVRRVRRHTATSSELEVVKQLVRTDREAVSQIIEARLANSREVHEYGKEPVQPFSGG
jgi:hypothetical protein